MLQSYCDCNCPRISVTVIVIEVVSKLIFCKIIVVAKIPKVV